MWLASQMCGELFCLWVNVIFVVFHRLYSHFGDHFRGKDHCIMTYCYQTNLCCTDYKCCVYLLGKHCLLSNKMLGKTQVLNSVLCLSLHLITATLPFGNVLFLIYSIVICLCACKLTKIPKANLERMCLSLFCFGCLKILLLAWFCSIVFSVRTLNQICCHSFLFVSLRHFCDSEKSTVCCKEIESYCRKHFSNSNMKFQ